MGDFNKDFEGFNLGDARLNKRAQLIIDGFMTNRRAGIPGNCKGMAETQGAYRFFNNAKVTPQKLLSAHMAGTLDRIGEHSTVLAIEDTSFLSFGGKRKNADLGPHTSGKENGLNLHLCLAVTPSGWNLGLLRSDLYAKDRQPGGMGDRKRRPIEQKESYRWLEGLRHCAELSGQLDRTQLVYVADRESDIYEVYRAAQENGAKWLVRAAYNRKTGDGGLMFEHAESAEGVGQSEWELKARPGRRARTVRQSVRVGKVRLKAPQRLQGDEDRWPEVDVRLVFAKEIDPSRRRRADIVDVADQLACRWPGAGDREGGLVSLSLAGGDLLQNPKKHLRGGETPVAKPRRLGECHRYAHACGLAYSIPEHRRPRQK